MTLIRTTAARVCETPPESLVEQLLEQMLYRTGRKAAPAEQSSWRRSLPVLAADLADAGLGSWRDLDLVETHDCFTSTFYMAIDHFGLTPPGQSFRAIEDGTIARGGACPFNPSGGLIGLGHPVGATGVRMVWDLARQVSGRAGDCQVEGARRGASLNIGGSATTSVSVVVTRGA